MPYHKSEDVPQCGFDEVHRLVSRARCDGTASSLPDFCAIVATCGRGQQRILEKRSDLKWCSSHLPTVHIFPEQLFKVNVEDFVC